MKYIQTYEGLINQMFQELKSVREKYQAQILECLAALEHEYNIVLKSKSVGEYPFEYATDDDIDVEPTEQFRRDILLAEKKLKQLGLEVEITFKLHPVKTTSNRPQLLDANIYQLKGGSIKNNIRRIKIKIFDENDIEY